MKKLHFCGFAAVILLSFIFIFDACSDGSGSGGSRSSGSKSGGSNSGGSNSGGSNSDEYSTTTFSNSKDDITYTFIVQHPIGRAVIGDLFTLKVTMSDIEKICSGMIVSIENGNIICRPKYKDAPSFTISLNGTKITLIIGITITFDDSTEEPCPGEFTEDNPTPSEDQTPTIFNVSNTGEWNDAVSAISSGGDDTYIINVMSDFAVAGLDDYRATFGDVRGVTVTIQGEDRTISLSGNGNMLRIGSNQSVILREVTLRGGPAPNDSGLVLVDWYGAFTMESGEISGNTGGGVVVDMFGTFAMYGGKISGNTSKQGGVVVSGFGTFTMYGGEISGNTSWDWGGGGVYVGGYGTFIMYGGEITGNRNTDDKYYIGISVAGSGGVMLSGSATLRIVSGTIYGSNESDTRLRNTAVSELVTAALCRIDGTVEFGTFSGSTWIKNGNLDTTNDTIKVVNGILNGISMPNSYINVGTTVEWNRAVNAIAAYGSNNNYTINVTADFSVAGRSTNSFGSASGVTVTLQGSGRTLTLSGIGNMLRIGDNQSIILQELTLRGHSSNNISLVEVMGGTFIMNSGEISGNIFGSGDGNYLSAGGVSVPFGTFTMNGGRISGNTAQNGGGVVVFFSDAFFTMNGGEISGNNVFSGGGGVYVYEGTFTMNGGEISGNTAYSYGAGLYNQGTFRIVTGTIYGLNEANTSLRNASSGAALHMLGGTAQYGTFSGETWNSRGDLDTTNDTIKVVNGVLQ